MQPGGLLFEVEPGWRICSCWTSGVAVINSMVGATVGAGIGVGVVLRMVTPIASLSSLDTPEFRLIVTAKGRTTISAVARLTSRLAMVGEVRVAGFSAMVSASAYSVATEATVRASDVLKP